MNTSLKVLLTATIIVLIVLLLATGKPPVCRKSGAELTNNEATICLS